jgi:hypothetical protein
MGEVIRFFSKSERERARLIREARATYDSIFPPGGLLSPQPERPSEGEAVSSFKSRRSDADLTS